MSRQVEQIKAFVIHTRAFQESSMIIQLFSEQLGRISVIAKGIKGKRSQARKALLQPFQEIIVEIVGRGELKTLSHCELSHPPLNYSMLLKDKALACAYYANELITRALPEHQENPQIYTAYTQLLHQLNQAEDFAVSLRIFEMNLLTSIGIAPDCQYDVDEQPIIAEKLYILLPQLGFKLATETERQSAFSGSAVLSLDGRKANPSALRQAQQITRILLAQVIGNKPLQSRKMWQHIQLNES